MGVLLKLYLIVTGVGTAICLFFPSIVMVGMFLIVPGLILAAMPTAFLYGAVFAAIWFSLHLAIGGWPAAALGVIGTAALFYAIPMASHAESRARLAMALIPEVTPVAPVAIAGHVRIDLPSLEVERQDPADRQAVRPVRCNGLCAAALFTPGVETVTLNPIPQRDPTEKQAIGDAPLQPAARTFRLVRRDQCSETLRPTGAVGLYDRLEEIRALEAEWNLRLSTEDCIIAVPTREQHDAIIAHGTYQLFSGGRGGFDWKLGARAVAVERLEIRRGDKTVLRAMIAGTQALTRPLLVGAGGGLSNFRFGWNRSLLSNAQLYATLDTAKLLRAHTNLALTVDPAATARLVRERLEAMVKDPAIAADDTGWSAADLYFEQMKKVGIGEADRRLLPVLIRDPRMTQFDRIWDAIRGMGDDATLLRDPIVDRLATPGPNDAEGAGRTLGKAIGSLPEGSFAQTTPAELRLLQDPEARLRAPGLIWRQADRGAAAVPMLVEIVEYHAAALAASRSAERGSLPVDKGDAIAIDSARAAFCKLGPQAAQALPRLMALYRGWKDSGNRLADEYWVFALARIGQPVESFAKPERLSGTTEQYHRILHNRLATFRADRDCKPTLN